MPKKELWKFEMNNLVLFSILYIMCGILEGKLFSALLDSELIFTLTTNVISRYHTLFSKIQKLPCCSCATYFYTTFQN